MNIFIVMYEAPDELEQDFVDALFLDEDNANEYIDGRPELFIMPMNTTD